MKNDMYNFSKHNGPSTYTSLIIWSTLRKKILMVKGTKKY